MQNDFVTFAATNIYEYFLLQLRKQTPKMIKSYWLLMEPIAEEMQEIFPCAKPFFTDTRHSSVVCSSTLPTVSLIQGLKSTAFHVKQDVDVRTSSINQRLKYRSKLRSLSYTSLLSPSAWSSSLHITSSEEDLPKATAVTQQTKALISRKPLPLPVVLERGEEKGKSD